MDDTTQSRVSDVTSAATRKRRSSILKSQRPPRTPFCELEFNVATPTDTGKSRRVSFSRRTGVAEFVTNEATTTWKNFYEEHNKSLESSGNDPEMNHGKQPIAYLGKSIFDQQFEEVEAIDFMGIHNPGINTCSSINNINFAQLEYTETRLTDPQRNFELSAFTETQSKLFKDDLALTCTGEVTDRIDANFSAIQQIAENDDVDEIEKDLQRQRQTAFTAHNLSEYIEVDLNMTHVAIANDESDMSITDTINSPKVQDVSKSCSIDKKVSLTNKDWVVDKENIVINPYVAPRESLNFAMNDEPDKVLVFDGKRLTVETEKKNESYHQNLHPNSSKCAPQRKTIVLNCNNDLPNLIEESQASKKSCSILESKQSILLAHCLLDETQNKQKIKIYDDLDDITETQAVSNEVAEVKRRQKMVYDDDIRSISITQASPFNIIDKEKRKTVVYDNDNADISITQAVPANILIPSENNEKRKTIVFENEACDISMTQAIPANIIIPANAVSAKTTIVLKDDSSNVSIAQPILTTKDSSESRRTMLLEEDNGNISVTQSFTSSANLTENVPVPGRQTTVVFGSDNNISVTQALPSNIMILQNLNATTYDTDANISMTQAVPANILLVNNTEPNRRRTVVFGDEAGDLSITQAVPQNQVIQSLAYQQQEIESTDTKDNNRYWNSSNISSNNGQVYENVTKKIPRAICVDQEQLNHEETSESAVKLKESKRRTIVFQNDDADISITQAIPDRQVIEHIHHQNRNDVDEAIVATNTAVYKENSTDKRRTVVFENDSTHLSITQAVPINQVIDTIQEKQDIEAINAALHKESSNKRKTIVFENDDANISITQAVPTSQVIEAANLAIHTENLINKRTTIVFENDSAEILVTQTVPMNEVFDVKKVQNDKENCNIDILHAVLHKASSHKRRTIIFEENDADISVTQAVPVTQVLAAIQEEGDGNVAAHNEKLTDKISTSTVVLENNDSNMTVTQTVPINRTIDIMQEDCQNTEATDIALHKDELTNKRQTVIFDNDDADISMPKPIPVNQVIDVTEKENQNIEVCSKTWGADIFENDNADISVTQSVHANLVQNEKQSTETTNFKEERTEMRRTEVFDDDDSDISKTQAVKLNKVLPGNRNNTANESQIIATKASASFHVRNMSQNIIYDDDEGDISMTRAVSSSIILPDGQEKKRTIVVESVESLLENQDYFMDIDKMTESSGKYTENDISMTDLSDIEPRHKAQSDMCINKPVIQNFSQKTNENSLAITCDETASSLSKPIPTELASIQMDLSVKCNRKSIAIYDTNLSSQTNATSNVLIYQTITTNTENITAKTDKGNSQDTTEEKSAAAENKDRSECFETDNTEVKGPKLNEEIHSLSTKSGSSEFDADTEKTKVSAVESLRSQPKSSILNDLLDMSQSSFDDVLQNKDIVPKTSYVIEVRTNIDEADTEKSDNMFYITKDNEVDGHAVKSEVLSISESHSQKLAEIEGSLPLCIEYKDDDDAPIVKQLQTKLSILKNSLREIPTHQSKPVEQARIIESETGSKVALDMSRRKSAKGFKMANDTRELLEMISDFTDKEQPRIPALEVMKEDLEPVTIETRLSLENKTISSKPEPMKLNRTLKRHSIAISREDMMNNLSMANAALQKSRSDSEESDIVDETVEETPIPQKRSVRMSTDIVKQLQFEDDSVSDASESNQTPLKKTAFGEISYMKDSKAKVIPEYLECVSDGIKELIDDLVKPVTEVLPFTTTTLGKGMKKVPSTCSTQIQANLQTSSQVDFPGLYSGSNSNFDMNKVSSSDIISDAVNRSMSRALKGPEKSTPPPVPSDRFIEFDAASDDAENKSENTVLPRKPNYYNNSSPDSVLIFDQANPLNNVLLASPAPHAIDIHRYNPITPSVELESQCSGTLDDTKSVTTDRVTNQFRVEFKAPPKNFKNSHKDTHSISSSTSKPMSVDQYTEPDINTSGRDMEVNTMITVKDNRELLEVSSSLTLVDDALNQNRTHLSPNSHADTDRNSPVQVIYKVEELPSTKLESDVTSTDDLDVHPMSKKRVYSPTKHEIHKNCTISSLEVTPKPVTKIAKRSSSSLYPEATTLPAERDLSSERASRQRSPARRKSPLRKLKNKKPGISVTVQQLTTMVHVDEVHMQELGESSTTEPRSASASRDELALDAYSEVISSCTSSNNLRSDSSAGHSRSVSNNPSTVEWLPRSIAASLMDCHSGADIITMIDAMPFMGSPDCQWESVEGSAWSVLLLHSNLRLTVRFPAGARIRSDTTVLNTELETMRQDKRNPIAYLCVLFAGETMRYYMSRGCGAAADVGKLVRRLAGVARLAAQWARAMHAARARLAYSLSPDGWLALKVANTSFRTVWEVTMRLELVMESARAAPWPRACGVRVTRVLAGAGGAPPPDVSRALAATPRDWGHVPRTIWKVFRYLKHKKRDEDSILHL